MTNVNYEELISIIQKGLTDFICKDTNYDTYKDYKIILSTEQQFMKIKDKDSNNIYIVAKFNSADMFFGQTVVPVTLITLSEENKLNIAQKLMIDFAEEYNLSRTRDNTIQQIWQSPSVSNNFNAVYAGWRSLIKTTGAFVITKNAAYYDVYYLYTDADGVKCEQKIPTVSTSFSLVDNPDTQPFYNTHDFTKSIITFGSFSLSISTFLLNDNWIVSRVIDMLTGSQTNLAYNQDDESWEPSVQKDINGDVIQTWETTVNNTFDMEIRFFDGRKRTSKMKLINCQVSEQIGQIPVLILTLAE